MKKQLLFFFIFCSLTSSIALAQEIEWQKFIGGSEMDELYSIKPTSDGGYILGGQSKSDISGDKTENNIGGNDLWIVKTDMEGNIQWQNTIGGDDIDQIANVQQTTDGGYIVGGFSRSNISGDKTENCVGSADFWILKLNHLGTIQWQNSIGGSEYDFLHAIQQTADGGYVFGGVSMSDISGDKSENSKGAADYWVVKTNGAGIIQWQKTIGGSLSDELISMIQTSDGGYILGGHSFSGISGDKTENSNGDTDFWIVKIDNVGNIQWQNTIGGSSYDYLFSIQQTIDGGYIIGGRSSSNISGDKTEDCIGYTDFWMVKTDPFGNIQWQNTIGGSNLDELFCLKQTSDGDYILGGYSESNISGDKMENCLGISDFWVVKTDDLGVIQWQNTIGGNGSDLLTDIHETAPGEFILVGISNSDNSFDMNDVNNGEYDFCMIKLTNKYNTISGTVFADLNSNNTLDFGEPPLSNMKIKEQATGRTAFSNQNGDYIISVLDSGSFDVAPNALNNYNVNPVSHNAYFSGYLQSDSQNNFAFQPQGQLNDLCVSISPLGPFRSGFYASYLISYQNVGTTTIMPTVIFFPDSSLTFSFASISPLTVDPDSIVWSLGTLTPFQSGSIIVKVYVHSGLTIGSAINSSVRIDPISGGANPTCNFSSWQVFITGSFDPNDILVSDDTLTTTQLATEPFLDYIIRFQNTGNDTAFTVKILNLIDTSKLDFSTFQFVNASHNVDLRWISHERLMEFTFNNILLPDSTTNELLSHGYLRYRIKPKTNLQARDSITNRASIYFDFNDAVHTNTAVTKIVYPIGVQPPGEQYEFVIFPNPANSTSFIELNASDPASLQVTLLNIQGKMVSFEVHHVESGINSINLHTENLSSGIYLVRLVIDGNLVVTKLVKM